MDAAAHSISSTCRLLVLSERDRQREEQEQEQLGELVKWGKVKVAGEGKRINWQELACVQQQQLAAALDDLTFPCVVPPAF